MSGAMYRTNAPYEHALHDIRARVPYEHALHEHAPAPELHPRYANALCQCLLCRKTYTQDMHARHTRMLL